MPKTVKILLILTLALTAASPMLAQRRGAYLENSVRFRLGLFEPDGDSEYWKFGELGAPEIPVFTGDVDDFDDLVAGIDYIRYLTPRTGLMLSLSGWEGKEDQAYLFFEDQFGGDILHSTNLSITTLSAGFLFDLVARDRRLVPYVGAGGGLYFWDLEEVGDFIDFSTAPLEIFGASFNDDGETVGWYWLAGLRVGLTRTLSFFGEIREHSANDELSGDFDGFGDLDLSGREINGGVAWSF